MNLFKKSAILMTIAGILSGAPQSVGFVVSPEGAVVAATSLQSASQQEVGKAVSQRRQVSAEGSQQDAQVRLSLLDRARSYFRWKPVAKTEERKLIEQNWNAEEEGNSLFDEKFSEKLKKEYDSTVYAQEGRVNSPYHRTRDWEIQEYQQSRSKLAQWTAREYLNDQFKNLFRDGDQDSPAIQFLNTLKSISGVEEPDRSKRERRVTRIYSAQEQVDQLAAEEKQRNGAPVEVVAEEQIPTKLRAKLNFIYGKGSLRFSSPIVDSNVDVKIGAGEKVKLNVNRDFKKIELASKVSYGIDERLISFNLVKKITDQISLDLTSERKAGASGAAASDGASNDVAKVTYSLSF